MTDEELMTRFILEPRRAYMYDNDCWLVVKDNQTGEYLKKPGGKAQMRFQNSIDAFNYIKSTLVEGYTIERNTCENVQVGSLVQVRLPYEGQGAVIEAVVDDISKDPRDQQNQILSLTPLKIIWALKMVKSILQKQINEPVHWSYWTVRAENLIYVYSPEESEKRIKDIRAQLKKEMIERGLDAAC